MKSIRKVILAAKHDFYSEQNEVIRIENGIKNHLSEALLPLFESGSEDMRTVAREVYARFCDGYETHIEPPGSYL